MFIDTHLHLIDRTRLSYPWLSGAPALDRDWSFEAYETTARRIGIGGVLHMEVDVDPSDIAAETAMIADLMKRPGSLLLGAISSARPEDPGFESFLDGLEGRVVKGIRRVLHTMPDELSRSELFRANLSRLGARGLPFDLCVLQRQLDVAIDLVDACENTIFVLDHCGVPDIAKGNFDDWARAISALAERPNVCAKISGLTAYASPDWTLATLRPYVAHMLASFGAARVVWGSDSPVCTLNASLELWMAATQALLSGLSEDERTALASGNARRIWQL